MYNAPGKKFMLTRLLIYLFLLGAVFYFLSQYRHRGADIPKAVRDPKPNRWFRPKRNPSEVWSQVYETASMDEARVLQARLQEEEVECVLYEQGKKDIHGNSLKGIGVAVPKTAVNHAQGIINRMPA